jgi:hypothetical protein
MNPADSITDFLFYLAPPVLVFGMAYFLIKKFLDTNQRLKMIDMKMGLQKEMLPLRMQAFERVILYLERMSPNNLLVRVHVPGMKVNEFHKEILSAIRSEYEHNMTQQVYMSAESWNAVKNGRDELLKIINTSFEKCDPESPAAELSKIVFQTMMQTETFPIQKAIDLVKGEAYSMF